MARAFIPGVGIVNSLPNYQQQERIAKASLGIFDEVDPSAKTIENLAYQNEELQRQLAASNEYNSNIANMYARGQNTYQDQSNVQPTNKPTVVAESNGMSNDFLADLLNSNEVKQDSQSMQPSNEGNRTQQNAPDPNSIELLRKVTMEASKYNMTPNQVMDILNRISIEEQVAIAASLAQSRNNAPITVGQRSNVQPTNYSTNNNNKGFNRATLL